MKLVILDPVVVMLAATNINNAGSVRVVMAALDGLAKRQVGAVVLVHHIAKASGSPRQRGARVG